MIKKNMLGMNMTEWKHLSGLSDPYTLALAEAGVEAGVPPIVEARSALADLPDSPLDVRHGDDDVPSMPDAQDSKAVRLAAIKKSARNLQGKTRNAANKSANTPAKDRHKGYLELVKHRKTFVKEDVDAELLWAAFLEDRGSSAEEFADLLDLAIENDDDEMAIELLAIEGQLDELLGAIGAGLGKAAGAVGGALAKGAGAVARTAGNVVGQAAGGLVKGAKTAMGIGAAPGVTSAPAAGGGAPAGATPPAGAPPQAPVGATPPAQPDTVPAPAAAAGAPPAAPQKPGLLGRLVGGVAKGIGGAVGAAKSGYAAGKAALTPQVSSMDADDFEMYLGEEHGLTAEQYIEICEHAFAINDSEMIEYLHQMDEGIFDFLRGGKDKAAEQQAKHAETMKKWQAANDVVAKHGAAPTKAASVRGTQVGVSLKPVMGTSVKVPKARAEAMESVIAKQLQFSGYTDEYIDSKTGN